MATENKGKYYYLKLKDDFFDREEIKVLESMPDGYLYSNILMKMYLKSLKSGGRLMLRNVMPYTPQLLASVTGHHVGVITAAIEIFQQLELVEILDNGAMYMLDVENFVGQSSTEADRVRAYRAKILDEKILAESQKNLLEVPGRNEKVPGRNEKVPGRNEKVPGRNGGKLKENFKSAPENSEHIEKERPLNPTAKMEEGEKDSLYKCNDKRTPENRDKRLDIRDIDIIYTGYFGKSPGGDFPEEKKPKKKIPYQEIVDYLNSKTGKRFRSDTKDTKSQIKARFNEGYTLEDFKRVIDVKAKKWGRDARMVDFLRPRTLFGTKFESYLNETVATVSNEAKVPNVPAWAEDERKEINRWQENLNSLTAEQKEVYEYRKNQYSAITRRQFVEGVTTTEKEASFLKTWEDMHSNGQTMDNESFLKKYLFLFKK